MVTPQEHVPELARELGLKNEVYFKREDLHPYGSHKGRSIPHMIDEKVAGGARHFVISSSGNAALAAGIHIKKLNREGNDLTLEIFAGKNINSHKLKKLEDLNGNGVLFSVQERPLQTLFARTQDHSIHSLRQSSDDSALLGYRELASELLKIKKLSTVFIGTSSGTTAQALAEHMSGVEIHIVQTSSCHPMADVFVENYSSTEKSLADAIVDTTAIRKDWVTSLVAGGSIASNEEIVAAEEIVKKTTGISISPNSALSVVGLMQATYTGKEFAGNIVCMICGD